MIHILSNFAACPGGNFLGLPKWWAYLPSTTDPNTHQCIPQITGINDIWLIVAAVIELLLRVAGIIAVVMVVYGGITYMTSEGSPEDTTKGRNTIIYSLVGLIISISAALIVTFVARKEENPFSGKADAFDKATSGTDNVSKRLSSSTILLIE